MTRVGSDYRAALKIHYFVDYLRSSGIFRGYLLYEVGELVLLRSVSRIIPQKNTRSKPSNRRDRATDHSTMAFR